MRRFGEARAILHAPPSREGFQQLAFLCLDALRADAARADAELLPYALETLTRWPDALREPHPSWVKAMLHSHPMSAHWRLIRQLNLSASHTSDELWIRLAALPKLYELTSIEASHTRMSSVGLGALIASKRIPRLERLMIAHTDVALAIDKLPQAAWWPSLSALDLSGLLKPTRCPTQLWSAIGRGEQGCSLKHLDLSMSALNERGLSALANALRTSALSSLELSYLEAPIDQLVELIDALPTTIQRFGCANLSAHPPAALHTLLTALDGRLPLLRELDLQHAALSPATLTRLANALNHSKTLRRLDLSGNTLITHPTEELILSQRSYPNLQWLGVAQANLSLHALERLLEAKGLQQLKTLRVSAAHIEPLSARAAARGVALIA